MSLGEQVCSKELCIQRKRGLPPWRVAPLSGGYSTFEEQGMRIVECRVFAGRRSCAEHSGQGVDELQQACTSKRLADAAGTLEVSISDLNLNAGNYR